MVDNKAEFHTTDSNGADGAPISRQLTVTLSSDQYERLFFQPVAPRGDLSKRLGNPTLFGMLGFLIPYTSTILILCGFQGGDTTSLVGLNSDYYFLGGIAMNLAGVAEFVLGNTFPCAVFIIYGSHWCSLAYAQDPSHNEVAALSSVGGTTGVKWMASQGFHNVTMVLVSFTFFLGALRTNAFFVLIFFGLLGLFSFSAAADFAVPHAQTAEDQAHIQHLIHCAGGFGFIGLVSGWYLAILTSFEAVGVKLPLPLFDLSHFNVPGLRKSPTSSVQTVSNSTAA